MSPRSKDFEKEWSSVQEKNGASVSETMTDLGFFVQQCFRSSKRVSRENITSCDKDCSVQKILKVSDTHSPQITPEFTAGDV